MLAAVMILVFAALAAYYFRKYRAGGGREHLKSCGTSVLAAVFIAAFLLGVEAVVYPEKTWRVYSVLLAGSLAGTALLSAGYEGWRKVSALVQGVIFVAVAAVLLSSLAYFRTTILMAKARGACVKAVPGCGGNLSALEKPGRELLAPGLTAALDSPDRLTRLGALYSMAYLPEESLAAAPKLAAMLAAADEDELSAISVVLERMGPAAAEAAPGLERRLAGPDGRTDHKVEAALRAVRPPAKTGSAGQ